MKVIEFCYADDHERISKWGKGYKFSLPAEEYLPSIGVIIEDTACGFLYLSNSRIAWIEWVFSNPESHKEKRKEAIDHLFQELEQRAIKVGMKAIFSSANILAYMRILERNGFKEADKNMIQYIKRLD